MRWSHHPYLLLTLANLFWAGNWIIGRAFRDEVPPLALSFWRWVIALICLLPLAWPHLRGDRAALLANWHWLLLFGALGTGCYNALAYLGLQQTTAINGLTLNSFVPIMIIALSWALFGRRLGQREAVGVLTSLVGVLTIVAHGDLSMLLGLRFNNGDLWVLGSVVAWSAYTLLLPHRPDVHPLSFLAAISVTGLIALAPFYLWEMLVQERFIVFSTASLAGMAYTGIFPAFLGFILWNRGVAEVGPSKAGLFMHLIPLFGIVLSILFLGELPRIHHGVGISLILTGIWLNSRGKT